MKRTLPLLLLLTTCSIAAHAQLPASSDSAVGVGLPAPLYRLDVRTAIDNDGLRLRSLNSGNLRMVMTSQPAGKEYSLLVAGPGSAFGAGNFVLTDLTRLDSARLLINGNTGNIAIGGGSSNPDARLAVNGMIQATTMRLTHNAGVNLIMSSDAAGNGLWQPANALNLVSGSGTLNYVPKWTPNGFTMSNSQIVDDGTNVGIGNVAPLRKLDISSSSYAGVNITAFQTPTLNLTSSNSSNTGGELIRFGEPTGVPGGLVRAQIGFFRSGDFSANANHFVLTVDSVGSRPDITISKATGGNVGIGKVNPLQKLDVAGTVRATGLLIPTNAGAGKVLTSDAAGNATWQTPAAGGGSAVIYSSWITSPYSSRDTTIDGTCVRVRHLDAPSLSTTALSNAVLMVYFRVGTIGPYNLPYTSDAGGATNQVNCIYNTQKIFVYRHTHNTCRFTSAVPESYPGQPVLVSLPQFLEYRYVIILGTQAGGRMALGPNEHYASSLDAIPDMGPAQGVPGKVYSSVKE